jgi:hypothetical protein
MPSADSKILSKEHRHRGMSLAAEEIVMDSIFYFVGVIVVVLVVGSYLGLA